MCEGSLPAGVPSTWGPDVADPALKLELDKSGDVVGARNAVMTVHADGTLGPRYDKAHLVPYGEYLPMRPILSALGLSRLAPGSRVTTRDVLSGPFAKLSVAIFRCA